MRRMFRAVALPILCLVLVQCVQAHTKLPDVKPGHQPALSSDEAGLWMHMDRMETRLKTSGHLIRDKALNDYVRGIVCRLAGPHCRDIRVYLLRIPHFNATMAPNGAMQVWSGFLLRARNEAQLATVLGHEIGHFLKRHSLKRWRSARSTTDGLIFAQIAMGAAGVGQYGNLAGLLAMGGLLAFNRDQEREADEGGLATMRGAGYDPRQAARVWDQLIAETEASENKPRPPLFFSTHPPSKERSRKLKARAESMVRSGPVGETGRERFRAAMAGHRAAYLGDDLNLREFKRSKALLEMLLEDGWRGGELHFFLGELHRLRAGEGDDVAALAAYDTALGLTGAPPETHRARGVLLLRKGAHAEANAAFGRYLAARPEAGDAAMVRHLMKGGK